MIQLTKPVAALEWRHEDTGYDFRWHLYVYGHRVGCLLASYKKPGWWDVWVYRNHSHVTGFDPSYYAARELDETSARRRLLHEVDGKIPHYDPELLAAELAERERMWGMG